MKNFFTLIALTVSFVFFGQARVQVIHNSADLAAATVDVYINGDLAIDNFAFRTATEFIDLPAGVQLNLGIAPANSTSVADVIANFPVTLADNNKYVVVADGIVSPTGYSPATAFDLKIYPLGREQASNAVNTDVLVHHGSTDAPTVDVVEIGAGAGTIVDNLAYGQFQGYLELPTANYVLDIRDETGTTSVVTYRAPLETFGLDGAAIVVVASGFLNPANNSNGEAFGLWVALPEGGNLIPLPVFVPTARVQVIHNSADLAAAQVDVYINGDLVFDNFAFRTASPFTDLPADVELNIGIAPANSTSVADVIANFPVTLADDNRYVVVADGIVSPTGYSPATAFDLKIYPLGREQASSAANTDVLVHHGSTDAPTVDVVEIGAGAGTIVDDLAYGQFQGYLELQTANYVLDIRDESGTTSVVTYRAPLETFGLDGAALVVVASGFLNPANNSNGPAFGLWAALPSGGNLIPLPVFVPTARVQVIHNSADLAAAQVDVYINGDLVFDNFAFRTASPFTDLPADVELNIGIAPANSTSVADVIANFPLTLADDNRYVVVADGIVSPTGYSPATAFDLKIYPLGREQASNPANTDVLVHHGSTDAPTVDVVEIGAGAGTIVDDLAYGEFQGYLELQTANYVLDIRDESGTTSVVTYNAPLETFGLDGAAIVVVASGFLNPANNSNGAAFGLWVALPEGGNLIPLPLTDLNTEIFSNSSFTIYPNPTSDSLTLIGNFEVTKYQVIDMNGRLIMENTINTNTIDVSKLNNGVYMINVISENGLLTKKFIKK